MANQGSLFETKKINIKIEGLSYKYPMSKEQALQNIDLEITHGEYVVLVGPSGCGKTTLTYTLNGIIPHIIKGGVLEGGVKINGKDVRDYKVDELSLLVGTVFQDPETQLFTSRVLDEVAMSLENRGYPPEEIWDRIDEALRIVGLKGFEHRHPSMLSGGQKQKVAIASVIALKPPLLILDDPTSDLDPVTTRDVLNVLDRIKREYDLTILLIEHKIERLLRHADRFIVMDKGQIVLSGDPEDVMTDIDTLQKYDLRPPEAAEISYKLHKLNPNIKVTIDVDELYNQLVPYVKQKKEKVEVPPRSAMREYGEPVIDIRNLNFVFPNGFQALKNINLTIRKGEYVAIIGKNGSGKTTMVSHMIGLYKPARNSASYVRVGGVDTRATTSAILAERVGFLFQNPNHQLFNDTVDAEVEFGPRILKFPPEKIKETVEEAIELAGIQPYLGKRIDELSKGERQRVAVAAIVAMQPEVLIFDEPTTGQDHRSLKPFIDIMRRIHQEGKTVVIVTHDMSLVAEEAERVILMNEGEILADGPPGSVFKMREVLKKANIEPPDAALLAEKLHEHGFPRHAITPDEIVSVFEKYYFK